MPVTTALADVVKAYDVRGLVPEQLSSEVAHALGVAFAEVVALPEGAEIDPAFVAQLAALHPDIDPSTFTPQDATTATVTAHTGTGTWLMVLRKGGAAGWQLVSTVPVR